MKVCFNKASEPNRLAASLEFWLRKAPQQPSKEEKPEDQTEETAREEPEEAQEPCPACGGVHKGSFCQMPPGGLNHVR